MNLQDTAWGKFDKNDGSSHHLAHHCADVAACFLAIAKLPIWQARFISILGAPLVDTQQERLAVLVFLHDIGKLYPGFQAKVWSKDEKSKIPASHDRRRALESIGHVEAGAALFLDSKEERLLQALQIDEIATWGNSEALIDLFLVSFAHHGRPV